MKVRVILLVAALVLSGCDNPTPKTSPPEKSESVLDPGTPLAGAYVLEDAQGHACVIKLGDEEFPDTPGIHPVWLRSACESAFAFLGIYKTWIKTGEDIAFSGRRDGERSYIVFRNIGPGRYQARSPPEHNGDLLLRPNQ